MKYIVSRVFRDDSTTFHYKRIFSSNPYRPTIICSTFQTSHTTEILETAIWLLKSSYPFVMPDFLSIFSHYLSLYCICLLCHLEFNTYTNTQATIKVENWNNPISLRLLQLFTYKYIYYSIFQLFFHQCIFLSLSWRVLFIFLRTANINWLSIQSSLSCWFPFKIFFLLLLIYSYP